MRWKKVYQLKLLLPLHRPLPPTAVVLVANSKPLFCAKLFSTTAVKNGQGIFADAEGLFVAGEEVDTPSETPTND